MENSEQSSSELKKTQHWKPPSKQKIQFQYMKNYRIQSP